MKLTEIEAVGCLADGELPGLGSFLAVRACNSNSDVDRTIRHVLSRGVADRSVLIGMSNGLAVDGHDDGGIIARVGNIDADGWPLVFSGLRARGGRHIGEERLILDSDGSLTNAGVAIICIQYTNLDIHAFAGDILSGDRRGTCAGRRIKAGCGVNAIAGVNNLCSIGSIDIDPDFFYAEQGIDGICEGIILINLRIEQGAEADFRIIHDIILMCNLHIIGNRVEVEGVDGIVSDIVHAVGFKRTRVVLHPLAVLVVVFCGAALHFETADAAAAFAKRPVGVLRCRLAVKCVIACAVGAKVAVIWVVEAVVVAVLFNCENHAAVCGDCLAVHDCGSRRHDGGAVHIVILCGEHRFCVLVINHNLVAFHGQITDRRRFRNICDKIELLRKERFIRADGSKAAPITLFGKPFEVVAARRVLNIEAVLRCGG